MNPAKDILEQLAREFLRTHQVEIRSKGVFPNWHSRWLINGRVMNTEGVKKLLIPKVMEMVGPDPKVLKQVIWKILSKTKVIVDLF